MVSAACAGPIETQTISVGFAPLLEPERLLDGDLVKGVHRHLDVCELDTAAVALDANLDIVINDPLYRHQDFHQFALVVPFSAVIARS